MTNCKLDNKKLVKLTPKWRLILLIVVSTVSFMVCDWRFYLANLFITLTLGWVTNVSYNTLYKQINGYFYPLVIVFGIHAIWGNWLDGINIILRFYNILIFALWVLFTTSYIDIVEGLESLLKPLSYIAIEPAKVSLAFTLVIRFIPLIIDTLYEVKMAQAAKGIDKNFLVLLIPSIVKIMNIADGVADAIEARS